MGKRLISTNSRVETILKGLPEGTNISAFVNGSVLDEYLPVYSQLRTESLYLLDIITDGAKEWTGNKLNINGSTDPRNNIDFYTKQTLERGIEWLKHGHHIKNPAVLKEAMSYYVSGDSGTSLSTQNEYVQSRYKEAANLIKKKDPDYSSFHVSIRNDADDILDHWKDKKADEHTIINGMWDEDVSYEVLAVCAQNGNLAMPIPPLECIRMLQKMETQFIIESIGEK